MMKKDDLINAAVAMGLYGTKTAARAVPVETLRSEVTNAARLRTQNALLAAEQPKGEPPAPLQLDNESEQPAPLQLDYEETWWEIEEAKAAGDSRYTSQTDNESETAHATDEDAYAADQRKADDRWLAEINEREVAQRRSERRVPTALRQRLEDLREMSIVNRQQRRRHAAMQRDAVRTLKRLGFTPDQIRAVL